MVTRKAPARYQHVRLIDVFLWGEKIGAVALDPAYGYYVFKYTDAFAASGVEPAPLQMPTRENRGFIFTDLPEPTFKRLPAMLSDALPDDFGNALINRYMAEQGIDAASITPLDRLAYMSTRAMGALSFRPARGPRTRVPAAIVLGELVTAARGAVHGTFGAGGTPHHGQPDGSHDGGHDAGHEDDATYAALRSIIEVGTSAGGARAKAVIAWNRESGEIRSGQFDAQPGFEHWLLKFDGMGRDAHLGSPQDYGRIEYAYFLMARAAGIPMSDCELLEENGRAHFMTRRFDREGASTHHHMQTLCAMAHVDYKRKGTNAYAQLFGTASRLRLPYEQMEDIFRRMAFNVMARNCDDHSKNFSFRLRQGQPWELAPAYDVTFSHNPNSEWTHQHLMSVNGKFKGFTRQDLLTEAERFGVGTAKRVLDQVGAALRQWPAFAQQAALPEEEMARIGKEHRTL